MFSHLEPQNAIGHAQEVGQCGSVKTSVDLVGFSSDVYLKLQSCHGSEIGRCPCEESLQ